MYAVSNPRKNRHHKIDVIARKPLNPSEYCRRWVDADPEERGYKTKCKQVISRITGVSIRSMERWGEDLNECPEYVKRALRKQDILNQIKETLKADIEDEIEE